jgi:hypothetical protein
MRKWIERSNEVAYLLNPAFCGRLLYSVIRTYTVESNRAFPFPLVYLILPLLLHKNTREVINSKTQLLRWIQKYEYLFIDFPKRTKELVQITNEAIELLLASEHLVLTANAELNVTTTKPTLSKTRFTDDEVKECIAKSEHIAKWFARTGKPEIIYISMGVRP